MSRTGALALARELERLEAHLVGSFLPRLESDYERAAGQATGSYRGRGTELISEAQVRAYVLTPILKVLGWRVDVPDTMVVEAPAEASLASGHRQFLDYYGRLVDGDEAKALLVVEAKRLSLALPSADRMTALDCMREALRTYQEPKSNVTVQWRDIFSSVAEYVRRLDQTSNDGAPKRLLLSNGRWYVVFLSPVRTLINRVVDSTDLLIAESPADARTQARELYQNLSYEGLSGVLPTQYSTDFRRFLDGSGDALPASIAIEISTGDLATRPLMAMTAVAHVRVSNGDWVRFKLEEADDDPIVLRKDAELEADMQELSARANGLLAALRAQHPIHLVSATGFESTRTILPAFPETVLLKREAANTFVLNLGDQMRPLLGASEFDSCQFHAHGAAHAIGYAVPETPILKRSSSPPAYFPSGSTFHCSHRTVHALREDICTIRQLDDFLCCRRCALQSRCWPAGFAAFPCARNP